MFLQPSFYQVIQQESQFVCEFGNRMVKRAERIRKAVDKTRPEEARQRLLSKNMKIKADGVLYPHNLPIVIIDHHRL